MPARRVAFPAFLVACTAALAGCAEPRPGAMSGSDTPAARGPEVAAHRGTDANATRLDSAARRLVAFLRGGLPFDSVRLADTVVLRVAPEGGGDQARVPRAELRAPAAWAVPANRARYVLVPPTAYVHLTTRVGRHLNCREYALATRAPSWAAAPHVGVRLAPDTAVDNCLRTWNATFVFDTSATGEAPRLVGVLYDQWEW